MAVEASSQSTRRIPDVVRRILTKRGMPDENLESFLYPSYSAGLHDPYLLTDMTIAVDRIELAAKRGQKVAVYGDYDIDGITASCVMLEALLACGIEARCYIPDRFEEGYGINQEALAGLKEDGIQLVISVDCGITSVNEARWARDNGIDLIITDHHSVPDDIPDALAVINPKRPGDNYPYADLAGVGVAFKVACALQIRTGMPKVGHEKWWLDLVAMGTICDVVPLVGENRLLATYGLKVLRKSRRSGIEALAAICGLEMGRIEAHHLGYMLGPRMNAAGRLKHAMRSVELLQTADISRAHEIALELDELNKERRLDQDRIIREAEEMAEPYLQDPVLVLADAGWSHGVVGIVASSLVEKYKRPVIVAQILGETTKGSARSVPGFNMVEALRSNEKLLTKFGGHFFAAGCTFETIHLEALRRGMCEYYVSSSIGELPVAVEIVDVELRSLADVSLSMIDDIGLMEPFGSGNPTPKVSISNLIVKNLRTVGKENKHLRIVFSDESGRSLTGIGFGLRSRYANLHEGDKVVAIGELNKNEWMGIQSPQLIIRELLI
jgi:single-stranded-DNA-specific exonuclease